MHMISNHLNILNLNKYKYKTTVCELIKYSYKILDPKLDYLSTWSYAIILCLQIGNPSFDFELQKRSFFKKLKVDLL